MADLDLNGLVIKIVFGLPYPFDRDQNSKKNSDQSHHILIIFFDEEKLDDKSCEKPWKKTKYANQRCPNRLMKAPGIFRLSFR